MVRLWAVILLFFFLLLFWIVFLLINLEKCLRCRTGLQLCFACFMLHLYWETLARNKYYLLICWQIFHLKRLLWFVLKPVQGQMSHVTRSCDACPSLGRQDGGWGPWFQVLDWVCFEYTKHTGYCIRCKDTLYENMMLTVHTTASLYSTTKDQVF